VMGLWGFMSLIGDEELAAAILASLSLMVLCG
jgi:hypothetical protein